MAGVYFHIPFCAQKCLYCDFYSVASVRHRPTYCDALLREWQLRREELNGAPLHTIYFGGGTPSILPVSDIARVLDALPLSHVTEITIEVNPDDITREYANALAGIGINRISMGVQSFDDGELRFLRRRHDAHQALKAFETLRNAGFGNISLDLMFALPGQTLLSWQHTITQTLALRPEHISCYSLMYEDGTLLSRLLREGKIKECDDALNEQMYRYLISTLKDNGYQHYEISNFSLPGSHSRHNSSYWDGTPYLGLGTGAHSFDGNCRRYNPSNVALYTQTLQSGRSAYEEEHLTEADRYNEFIMTRLRTARGIDLDLLSHSFQESYIEHFLCQATPLLRSGRLKRPDASTITLSEEGLMLCDSVMRDLFWV